MQINSNKNKKITDRVLQLLDLKGVSKYKFHKDLGFSNGFLDKSRDIGTDKYAKILEYFPDINPDWLLTGKGPMLRGAGTKVPAEQSKEPAIPLIPAEAFAGTGGMPVQITDSMIEDYYVVPEWRDVDFLIRVFGNSMYPTYYSGDIVACRQINERSFFSWGKIYVLHHNDYGIMIKRLFPGKHKGAVLCRSDNSKEYPDFEVDLTNITNIAIVVGGIKHE